MWIATTTGFYSVVQHRTRRGHVLVRARDRGDLERLLELGAFDQSAYDHGDLTIEATPRADYPYRVLMPRAAWHTLLMALAVDIDYPNFKDAVKDRQGPERASIYMRVWGALRSIEPWARKPEPTLAAGGTIFDLPAQVREQVDAPADCERCDDWGWLPGGGDWCPDCNPNGDRYPF